MNAINLHAAKAARDMKPVKSSAIEAIGHDPDAGVLRVRFTNGNTFRYEGVSAAQHTALLNADSVGGHFSEHIRGKFKAVKV